MRLVLTGSKGFVGAAILHRIASEPNLALRSAGDRRLPTEDIAADLSTDWRPLFAQADVVLHLAARAHRLYDDATHPLAAYRAVNTSGTVRLAEQAAAAGVRRFVFASTVKVHGESSPASQPWNEATCSAPTDPYALSKHEAELGLAAIAARTGMEVVIVRPPLVYGPGVKANFAALMRAVAHGWPLPLGSIDNRRSLVGVDNLVDLLLLCLEHPAAANQTFLVSDGEDLSTPDLLRRMGRALDRPARLLPVPPALLKAGATLLGRRAAAERLCGNLQVDITKARALLGWQPPVTVDEGLRRAAQGMAR